MRVNKIKCEDCANHLGGGICAIIDTEEWNPIHGYGASNCFTLNKNGLCQLYRERKKFSFWRW